MDWSGVNGSDKERLCGINAHFQNVFVGTWGYVVDVEESSYFGNEIGTRGGWKLTNSLIRLFCVIVL